MQRGLPLGRPARESSLQKCDTGLPSVRAARNLLGATVWHALNVEPLNSDPCKHSGAESFPKMYTAIAGGGEPLASCHVCEQQLDLIKKSFRGGGARAKVLHFSHRPFFLAGGGGGGSIYVAGGVRMTRQKGEGGVRSGRATSSGDQCRP